jgi:hypothetical protein
VSFRISSRIAQQLSSDTFYLEVLREVPEPKTTFFCLHAFDNLSGTASNIRQDSKLRPFAKALSRMNDKDQRLLLHMASKMANRA